MPANSLQVAAILDITVERPVTVDDLSEIRHLHRTAFHRLADRNHEADLSEAFDAFLYSAAFTSSILSSDIIGLWQDRALIGTAGWQVTDEAVPTSRIAHVSVNPMFAGMGLGRHLVTTAEERARAAGFRRYSARATANSVRFFERLGYSVTSHGVTTLRVGSDLPITYMRRCLEN